MSCSARLRLRHHCGMLFERLPQLHVQRWVAMRLEWLGGLPSALNQPEIAIVHATPESALAHASGDSAQMQNCNQHTALGCIDRCLWAHTPSEYPCS